MQNYRLLTNKIQHLPGRQTENSFTEAMVEEFLSWEIITKLYKFPYFLLFKRSAKFSPLPDIIRLFNLQIIHL